MKKYLLLLCFSAITLLLTSCSPTPEETYMEALQAKTPDIAAIGTLMGETGDQMEKGEFSTVVTSLESLKQKADSLGLPAYTGEDALLKTASGEFALSIKEISNLAQLLTPIAKKGAVDANYILTEEESKIMKESEISMNSIDTHFEKANKALEEFVSKSSN